MRITFQKFIDKPELLDQLTHEEALILIAFYQYVEGRLMALKNEIESEEAINENAITIISIPKETEMKFRFREYSIPLVEKMKTCFSDDDFHYLNELIANIIRSLLN